MSLLRSTRLLSSYGRQAAKTAAISQVQSRNYSMPLTFASPAKAYYNETEVKQIDVPGYDSARGILPQHVPMLAVMRPGVLTVFESDDNKKSFFVSSGTITVNEDSSVQILAEEAVPVEQLDKTAISEGMSLAQRELDAASSDEAKAEAQIQLECFQAMSAAAGH